MGVKVSRAARVRTLDAAAQLVQARRREKRAGGSSPAKISVEQAIRDGQNSTSQGKEEGGRAPRKEQNHAEPVRWWMGGRLSGRVGRKGGRRVKPVPPAHYKPQKCDEAGQSFFPLCLRQASDRLACTCVSARV